MQTNFVTERCSTLLCLSIAVAAVLLTTGCGYPAARPENFEVITSLRTALSARNETWLQANEDKIVARHAADELSDEELAAFQSIIAEARRGNWADAERAALDFQRAQRPTEEQIRRLREKRR